MIKTGSDFSGVGAFDQALQRLGVDYETVFACDIDKYARQTYIENYGEPKYFPEDVYEREIPKEPLDIYMTSPPCQSFSLAGHRKGEDDHRGVLFYNSHEFIQKNRPRYFIFENVKGLLSDNDGKTFQVWLDYLGGKSVNGSTLMFPHEESVPYHIYWQVLNAKDYGVPQNRERVFIIGIRDDQDNDFTFPRPVHLEKRLRDVLEDSDSHKYLSKEKEESIKNSNYRTQRDMIQSSDGICGAVLSRDYKDPKCIDEKYYLSDEAIDRVTNKDQGFHSDIKSPDDIASCHGARDYEKLARGMNIVKTVARSNVDEKYYLSDKMIDGFKNHKERHEEKGTGFKWQPKEGDDVANALRANGALCPTDNSVIVYDIPEQVKIRLHDVDVPALQKCLKEHKKKISMKTISEWLGVKKTTVEHWFRTDSFFSIPDPEIWMELKEVLGIETDEFDKSIMDFEWRDGVYDKTNRVYCETGISPTITRTSADERIIESGTWRTHKDGQGFRKIEDGTCPTIPARAREDGSGQPVIRTESRIRRLTPRECFRLMDFPDSFTWSVSDTQAYKQAGNSIVVGVLYEIIKKLKL